jgi:hypothetical protein
MKILLFLIFLNPFLFSQIRVIEDFKTDYENGYYTRDGIKKKILKLSENEFLFYGEKGSIIKTNDSGDTWSQSFNGTYAEIIQMIYGNNLIYAITDFNEFLLSKDKGNYWEIIYLDYELKSIATLEDIIFISTNSDTILITENNGKTFEYLKTNISNIDKIFSFGNSLVLKTSNNELYYSNDFANNWSFINSPFTQQFEINKINDNIYLKDSNSIAKLSNNFEWEVDLIYEIKTSFNFYPFSDKYICFKHDDFKYRRTSNYFISKYDLKLKEHYDFDTLTILDYEDLSFYNQEHIIEDISNSFDELIIIFKFNRIVKSQNQNNWKVLNDLFSYNPATHKNIIHLNKKDKIKFTFYNSGILKSNDGGLKYSLTKSITDTIESAFSSDLVPVYYCPSPYSYHIIDSNNILVGVYSTYEPFLDLLILVWDYNNPRTWLKTTNGGKEWEILKNINDLKIKIQQQNDLDESQIKVIGHFEKNFILSQTYNNKTLIYSLNENNNIDTIKILNNSLFFQSFLDEKNDLIWFKNIFKRTNEDEQNSEEEFVEIYVANNNLSSFRKVFEQKSDLIIQLGQSKVGDIFIISNNKTDINNKFNIKIMKYDQISSTFSDIKFTTNYNWINYSNSMVLKSANDFLNSYNRILQLEEDIFIGQKSLQNGNEEIFITDFINFEINSNSINVNTIFNNSKTSNRSSGIRTPIVYLTNKGKLNYVRGNNNNSFDTYIPIEPERLEYYSSVPKTETRNYLWTYPPYPQPTNGIIKVETYWDSGLPFSEQDIEIYDLTGIKINLENTLTVQKESIYKGYIIWDSSNYKKGIYIMKITHGTETRVIKIMVVD